MSDDASKLRRLAEAVEAYLRGHYDENLVAINGMPQGDILHLEDEYRAVTGDVQRFNPPARNRR